MRSAWILVVFLHLIVKSTVPAPVSNSTECKSPNMKCQTGECIAKERICDELFDCSDGEDEMNCTSVMEEKCLSGHLKCSTGNTCIPNSFLCDGERDCLDGSDEVNCEFHKNKFSCNSSDSFVCKTKGIEQKVCLPKIATCDGIKECPLGDDEDECDVIKSCAVKGHKCQHFCEDRPGPSVCGCTTGYKLQSDGRSCKYDNEASSAGYLLTTFNSEIHQFSLADLNRDRKYTSLHSSDRIIVEIDYMRQSDEIFMAIDHGNTGFSGELGVFSNGRQMTLRKNIREDFHISVDWIGKNVFFTQNFRSPIPGIFACTTNGLFCRRIVEGKSKDQSYFGLVVHPMRGLIVWIDYINKWRHIMMSNMDGSEVRFLVEGKSSVKYLRILTLLAIDHAKNDVYFVDDISGILERINIDTKEMHAISSSVFAHISFGSVYSNGFLYWCARGHKSLMVQEVAHNQSSPHVIHKFNSLVPFGLAINTSTHQIEPSSNPCHELDCPCLCIIIPKSSSDGITAKCICPDGYTPSGDTCIPFSPFDEMEILKNYSHIGFELMSEYCKRGIACKNGGSCRQLFNQSRIVCDCKLLFDGQYCERINPEMHAALKEFKTQFGVFAVLSICILILLIVGCGALVKFATRKLKATSSPRGFIDEMTTTAKNATSPLVKKLRKIVGKEQEPSSTVSFKKGGKIIVENRPTTFNNPSFDEESNVSSAFSTSSSASFSTTIRFEDDGSPL